MKVAFYLDVYTGGSGRVVETFLDNFDKNIDKLIILNNPVKEFKSENTKFIILKRFKNPIINLIYRVFKINNVLKKNKIDVLCSMLTVPNITSIMATKFMLFKSKCIINEHTFLSKDIKLKYKSNSFLNSIEKFSLKSLIKFFYKSSDKIVVISKGMKSDLIKNYNINDAKVEVIYTPIHVNKIKEYSLNQPKHDWFKKYKIILGVGRLSPEKRFQDLIKSFEIVKKRLKNAKLIIIGKGGEKEKLVSLINKLKLNKDIEIIEFVDEPYSYMKHSSVLVLCSEYEGFGMVLAEAMTTNTPVISTNCSSGPEDILGKDYELFCKIRDVDCIARNIIRLIKDKTLRNSIIKRNEKRVSMFDAKIISDKYLDLIK